MSVGHFFFFPRRRAAETTTKGLYLYCESLAQLSQSVLSLSPFRLQLQSAAAVSRLAAIAKNRLVCLLPTHSLARFNRKPFRFGELQRDGGGGQRVLEAWQKATGIHL